MNNYLKIFAINLCLLSSNANADQQCTISGLSWLVGKWQMKTKNKIISEHWKSVSDNTMEGFGQTKREDGTASSVETLRIVNMSDEIFLLAKVTHNPLPVAFKAKKCGENSVHFENPAHDFPNRLHYFVKDQNLHVEVRDSGDKGFDLTFNRQVTDN